MISVVIELIAKLAGVAADAYRAHALDDAALASRLREVLAHGEAQVAAALVAGARARAAADAAIRAAAPSPPAAEPAASLADLARDVERLHGGGGQ